MFRVVLKSSLLILKHSLKWAVILGLAFGLIGGSVALIAGAGVQIASLFGAFGVYLGFLFGIGQGIKALFGLAGFDPYQEEPSPKGLVSAGDYVAGVVIPGYQYFSFVWGVFELIVSFRNRDYTSPDPERTKRAILEAVAWSIIAIGMVALLFAISLDARVLYGLLLVPMVALFGALCGADSKSRLNQDRKE